MAVLPNPRHELFAKYLSKGFHQTEAYQMAGFSGSTNNASALANKPHVKHRVNELQDEQQHDHVPVIMSERSDDEEGFELGASINDANDLAKRIIAGHEGPAALTQEWVIIQLISNVIQASAANKFGEVNKALAMLGTHLGMSLEGKSTKGASTDDDDKKKEAGGVTIDFGQMLEAAAKLGREDPKVINEPNSES